MLSFAMSSPNTVKTILRIQLVGQTLSSYPNPSQVFILRPGELEATQPSSEEDIGNSCPTTQ